MKNCCEQNFISLEEDVHWRDSNSSQSIQYGICSKCKQLLMIRFQYDTETGSDNIVLKPGETKRYYTFKQEDVERIEALAKEQGLLLSSF